MAQVDRSPLEYQANSAKSFRRFDYPRAPTVTDFKNFKIGDFWRDASSNDWYICCYRDTTQAIWRKLAGTAGAVETFLPDAGTSPVVPDASNQITFTGGNGIVTTGGVNTLDWAMQSPFEGNFSFENNTAATSVLLSVVNNDNNPISNAQTSLEVEDASGDAFLHCEVNGITEYSAGIDNSSAADYFKITDNASPSVGNELLRLYYSGQSILQTFGLFHVTDLSLVTAAEFAVIKTDAGNSIDGVIANIDNTNAGSSASFQVQVGGATAGDPDVKWSIRGGTEYSFGIDNDDSDTLKLTDGTDPSSGNTLFQMTTAGAPSFPTAPLDVPSGGTGVNTITDHALIVGSGVATVSEVAVGATGTVLIGTTGADPSFSATPTVTSMTVTAAPVSTTDAANKAYVDLIAGGFGFIQAVQAATTANLNAIYNNGAAGVGATLTNNGALAAFTIDGETLLATDRVLIKDQTSELENGVYSITTLGDGVTAWVLTRTTDFDQPAEIVPGALVPVRNGTINAETIWMQSHTVTTVGVDDINFIKFQSSPISTVENAVLIGDTNDAIKSQLLTDGQLVIGSTGVAPVASTLTAGTGISIANAAGSITITNTGSDTTWSAINANQTLVVNEGYICVAPGGDLDLTLPAVSSAGDEIEITLDGATSFSVLQGAGQQIRVGAVETTLGAGGSITTTAQGDSIRMVCSDANLRWNVVSSMGNLNLV